VAVVCNKCHSELEELKLEKVHYPDFVWRDIQSKLKNPDVLKFLAGRRPSPILLWWYGREDVLERKRLAREEAEAAINKLAQDAQYRKEHPSLPRVPTKEDRLNEALGTVVVWAFYIGFALLLLYSGYPR